MSKANKYGPGTKNWEKLKKKVLENAKKTSGKNQGLVKKTQKRLT